MWRHMCVHVCVVSLSLTFLVFSMGCVFLNLTKTVCASKLRINVDSYVWGIPSLILTLAIYVLLSPPMPQIPLYH